LTSKGRSVEFDNDLASEVFRTVQKQGRDSAAPILACVDADEIEEIGEESEDLNYRAEVLKRLKTLSPSGFEHFCQALLLEAGFEDVEVTGRSGDRGIDGRGTLKVNPLFSMKVAFQAKRYDDTVGSGTIRDFRGAVVGRADRGLLMTTGTFSRDAELEAGRDGATHVELIDGASIVDLMQQFEFGLKPVSTFRVDHGFFDKFEN
jgi:restriction system protein